MSAKILRPLGDLSYAFFIFQYPVWLVFKNFASPEWSRQSSFFFAYLLTLGVFSALINAYVEKPFMVWLRQKRHRGGNEKSREIPA
jgi:peptidoglycan/LPS O-acetylase OafA/YrhL